MRKVRSMAVLLVALVMSFLLSGVVGKIVVQAEDEEVPEGLVITWQDWQDDKYIFVEQISDADYGKVYEPELKITTRVSLGIADEDGNVTPIQESDIDKFTFTKNGKAVNNEDEASIVATYEHDRDDDTDVYAGEGAFDIKLGTLDDYILTYTSEGKSTSVKLKVQTPAVAVYSSDGTVLGDNAEYSAADKIFYINATDIIRTDGSIGTITIKDCQVDSANVETELNEKSIKVIIGESKVSPFKIYIDYEIAWEITGEEGDTESKEMSVEFNPDDNLAVLFDDGSYLDGEPQKGYSGTYIPKDWWENGNFSSDTETALYWVHADTIQEVIDELSKTAVGGKFTGYVMNDEGELEPADGVSIINTGYISVQPSSFGDIELTPQYVASSGNFKGILFDGLGWHPYYVRPDEKGLYQQITHTTGGSQDFVELSVLLPDEVATVMSEIDDNIYGSLEEKTKIINKVSNADGVVTYKDGVYAVKFVANEYTNRDGVKIDDQYAEFASADPIVVNANIVGAIRESDENNELKYYMTETMPGIHVNAYCDMKFINDMGNLVIGYPDKSLTQGKYYKTEIVGFLETGETNEDGYAIEEIRTFEISPKGPDSYTTETLINSPSENYTGQDYNYKIKTYAIDSEAKVEGTLKDDVSVVVPEPNSLTELEFEQRDSIEEGGKLTVSMTANEVDESQADATTKERIEAIEEAIENDPVNEYGRIEYIDLSVVAEAGNKKKQITETSVPMEVTIAIPKGYKDGAKFRIARYHKGEIFFFDLVDALRKKVSGLNIGYVINKEAGTITFLTDRFSTYALMEVGDDSRTEIDLSGVKWDYKEAFTADGTVKTVKLTGLPETVQVSYTDNSKTEAGKYNAKASLTVKDSKNYKLPDEIPASITGLSWEIKAAVSDQTAGEQQTPVTPDATPQTPGDAPADPHITGEESQTSAETPAALPTADVGTTISDTGSAGTSKYTVTDKSMGTGDAGEVEYSGEAEGSKATKISIPDTIVGSDGVIYEVTKIADNALKGNKTIKEVTVGNNIVEIGENAFQNAKKLTKVKLGTNVTTIDKNAFAGCAKLKKVTASGSSITTIAEGAFKGDKVLTSIDLSKSKLATIGANAFSGDKKLKTIKINGNNLKKVGKNAFKGVKKNATITILAKDKKTYDKAVKLIKKSKAKNVKYKFKKKK